MMRPPQLIILSLAILCAGVAWADETATQEVESKFIGIEVEEAVQEEMEPEPTSGRDSARTDSPLEWRGTMKLGGRLSFLIHNRETGSTLWLREGRPNAWYTIENFYPERQRLVLKYEGQTYGLSPAKADVADAPVAQVAAPTLFTPNQAPDAETAAQEAPRAKLVLENVTEEAIAAARRNPNVRVIEDENGEITIEVPAPPPLPAALTDLPSPSLAGGLPPSRRPGGETAGGDTAGDGTANGGETSGETGGETSGETADGEGDTAEDFLKNLPDLSGGPPMERPPSAPPNVRIRTRGEE